MARGRCGTRARSAVALSGFSHQCVDITFFLFCVCDCVCARSCQSVTVCVRPAKPACQSVILSVRPAKPACQSVTVCQACLPAYQSAMRNPSASQSIYRPANYSVPVSAPGYHEGKGKENR